MGGGEGQRPGESTRALIVGYGSIGRRHGEVLDSLRCDTAVLSRRVDAVVDRPAFGTLEEALAEHHPTYIVVADETSRHAETICALTQCGYDGRVLVEKPLFAQPSAVPENAFAALGVGYNLRFHPAVQALRQALDRDTALTVQASVGQYLPDWRPGVDYRLSYSADRERGGGVLRDLSHELDLLVWLFGGPSEVVAMGGRVSSLEIKSDDAWSALLRQPRSAMTSVHLDYLHHPGRRLLSITTEDRSLDLDLIAGTLTVNGDVNRFSVERNFSIRAMHAAMLTTGRDVCDASTAVTVMRTIAAIEESAVCRGWVEP